MKLLASMLLSSLLLCAQETPQVNRVAWMEAFPEPLPQGVNEVALEITSQWLRPDMAQDADHRTLARLDGEEWQLTGDLALPLGPGRVNLRIRGNYRSCGILDQAIPTTHKILGAPEGGRDLGQKWRQAYHLERDGRVVGNLDHAGMVLMDVDLAYLVPFGDGDTGGRFGGSLQLPTGHREDFSGSGGWDGLVGTALWKRWGRWRLHGQAERVFLTFPADSPYRAVLNHHSYSRIWAGGGWQGDGHGFFGGLGLDLTFAYMGSPYAVNLVRMDRAGWQQHWTFTHRALPRWSCGISEEAGTYFAPDVTFYLRYRP